jgi:hypothetical protein
LYPVAYTPFYAPGKCTELPLKYISTMISIVLP